MLEDFDAFPADELDFFVLVAVSVLACAPEGLDAFAGFDSLLAPVTPFDDLAGLAGSDGLAFSEALAFSGALAFSDALPVFDLVVVLVPFLLS